MSKKTCLMNETINSTRFAIFTTQQKSTKGSLILQKKVKFVFSMEAPINFTKKIANQ